MRRRSISRAHTATHMVHQALRDELGDTATQAGSENSPGRLRFDFKSLQAVPAAAMGEIEARINAVLLDDLPVTADIMTIDAAKKLGAMALFGEKYGERVRVVSIGEWSRELCVGTHTPRVGQIGVVKLLGESSIGSGVRRVEALVGADAYSHLAREATIVSQLTDTLGVRRDELPDRIATILGRLRDAEKEIAAVRQSQVLGAAAGLVPVGPRHRRRDLRQPRRGRRRHGRRPAQARHRRARPPRQRPAGARLDGLRRRTAARSSSSRRTSAPARSASRPAPSSRSRPRRSAAAAAARTTSPRAAAPTRRKVSAALGAVEDQLRQPGRVTLTDPRPRPGARVGVDVGNARVGVAASDAVGACSPTRCGRCRVTSRPTATSTPSWPSSDELEAIEVVVGLPRLLSGEEGEAARIARDYAGRLAARLGTVGVRMVDERLTTVDAHRRLRDSGVPGRGQRAVVDQAAAVLILQSALDTEALSGRPAGGDRLAGGQTEEGTSSMKDHLETSIFGDHEETVEHGEHFDEPHAAAAPMSRREMREAELAARKRGRRGPARPPRLPAPAVAASRRSSAASSSSCSRSPSSVAASPSPTRPSVRSSRASSSPTTTPGPAAGEVRVTVDQGARRQRDRQDPRRAGRRQVEQGVHRGRQQRPQERRASSRASTR